MPNLSLEVSVYLMSLVEKGLLFMFRDMSMQKHQLSFLYVTKYLQKHAQKIQLTKQKKGTIEQPPTTKI